MNVERVIRKINIEMNAFNESGGREDKACAEGLRRARTYIQLEALKRKILTHDQQIVLEWLENEYTGDADPFGILAFLFSQAPKSEVTIASLELTRAEQSQVLQVFSQWMLEQEEKE